jgi:hypothetical protein
MSLSNTEKHVKDIRRKTRPAKERKLACNNWGRNNWGRSKIYIFITWLGAKG